MLTIPNNEDIKLDMTLKVPTHAEFVAAIRKHLEKKDEKPSTFGRRVLGDSGAVLRLLDKENPTDPRLSTVNKIADDINAKDVK